jgi:hypothetical protein
MFVQSSLVSVDNPVSESLLINLLRMRDSLGYNATMLSPTDQSFPFNSLLVIFNGDHGIVDYWDDQGQYFGSTGDQVSGTLLFQDGGLCVGESEVFLSRVLSSDTAELVAIEFFRTGMLATSLGVMKLLGQ